jgi:hypothetical protein
MPMFTPTTAKAGTRARLGKTLLTSSMHLSAINGNRITSLNTKDSSASMLSTSSPKIPKNRNNTNLSLNGILPLSEVTSQLPKVMTTKNNHKIEEQSEKPKRKPNTFRKRNIILTKPNSPRLNQEHPLTKLDEQIRSSPPRGECHTPTKKSARFHS